MLTSTLKDTLKDPLIDLFSTKIFRFFLNMYRVFETFGISHLISFHILE